MENTNSSRPMRAPASRGRRRVALVGVVVAVALLAVGGAWYTGLLTGQGTLLVKLHDAPCSCQHVYVTFTATSVHRANGTQMGDGGWFTVSSQAQTWDLLRLNGTALSAILASASVPAGHYTSVDLTVQNVTVVLTGGTTLVASVPNATVHIEGPFTVSAGSTTTLTLDVNLQTSLHLSADSAVFTPNVAMVVS